MFLNDKEKNARTKALEALIGKLDSMDMSRLDAKKKPVAAEVSVTAIEPKESEDEGEENELEEAMSEASHDEVESAEEKFFPEEEKKEEQMMGESYNEEEPSEEEKEMIKALYEKYFG